MPKKFTGENSKAVQARERKDKEKEAERQRKVQQAEEEDWKDDDKHTQKKSQRKDEKEKKRQEQLMKKAENRSLADQELEIAAASSAGKAAPSKVTRAQIQAEQERREAAARGASLVETHLTSPLPENVNKMVVEGLEARNIEEAISILSVKEEADLDKHPERRLKAAYTAFEEKHLDRLRMENPNLRLSQVKQLLHKEWLKSPENPLNRPHARQQ